MKHLVFLLLLVLVLLIVEQIGISSVEAQAEPTPASWGLTPPVLGSVTMRPGRPERVTPAPPVSMETSAPAVGYPAPVETVTPSKGYPAPVEEDAPAIKAFRRVVRVERAVRPVERR
jgi:hypothetical protein